MAVYRCLSMAACRVVAKHRSLQGAFICMKLVYLPARVPNRCSCADWGKNREISRSLAREQEMRVNRLPEAERGSPESNGLSLSLFTFSFHFVCFAFLILGKLEERKVIPYSSVHRLCKR